MCWLWPQSCRDVADCCSASRCFTQNTFPKAEDLIRWTYHFCEYPYTPFRFFSLIVYVQNKVFIIILLFQSVIEMESTWVGGFGGALYPSGTLVGTFPSEVYPLSSLSLCWSVPAAPCMAQKRGTYEKGEIVNRGWRYRATSLKRSSTWWNESNKYHTWRLQTTKSMGNSFS